jgi:hypothetical protein
MDYKSGDIRTAPPANIQTLCTAKLKHFDEYSQPEGPQEATNLAQ